MTARVAGSLRVSVVVPVRDDAQHLDHLLALLARQTVPPYEVVVVDNASTDGSATVAHRWGAVVVHEPEVGIPAAAAAGYDAAKGEIIGRLDADSRPDERWVQTLMERMGADPSLDALTGTGRFHDLPRGTRTAASLAYLGTYYVLCHLALGHVALWGSCMALRATAWEAVRTAAVRTGADVHDDLDLAFRLGPARRTRLDRTWRVGVSARSLRGRHQRRRRLDRAWRTLRLNWAVSPPWERWRARWTVRGTAAS
ncbi:glycosyltransferase family A protein [Cellulosimicrobium marinum]|uniref:glycosyltransferase family A protein n=1 Tax=Cellulosimicrobium marinum TaxID=1638992 RepID=UPI001E30AE97|nr:glycosyltransferase family A protein [Cellulosimicrobium marinum]MCB7137463.1 glycosyltransferase family 2 protein [Cellulosimicrobium marinum]